MGEVMHIKDINLLGKIQNIRKKTKRKSTWNVRTGRWGRHKWTHWTSGNREGNG